MRLVEFDGRRFVDDVTDKLHERQAKQTCLRVTGISTGTLNRICEGHPVKDITTILSLCVYLGLSIKSYLKAMPL